MICLELFDEGLALLLKQDGADDHFLVVGFEHDICKLIFIDLASFVVVDVVKKFIDFLLVDFAASAKDGE